VQEKDKGGARKAYAAPRLKEFGRIAELTATLDNMGMMDGGAMPTNRT